MFLVQCNVVFSVKISEFRSRQELRNCGTVCVVLAHSESAMDGIIYLVGLIVIIMFILSFLGLH